MFAQVPTKPTDYHPWEPSSYVPDDDACPVEPKPPRLTPEECEKLEPDRDDPEREKDDDEPLDHPLDDDDRKIGRYAPR
jgi:hypothetical protein